MIWVLDRLAAENCIELPCLKPDVLIVDRGCIETGSLEVIIVVIKK